MSTPRSVRARRCRRRDARHQAEVVVGAPPDRALGRPSADIAVVDGLGVGVGWWERDQPTIGDGSQEAVARTPVIGHVVVDPETLDGPGRPAQDDMEPLRSYPLDPLQLIDIRADLKHGAGLDVPGELGVRDLVVVVAPHGWAVRTIDPEQEVGVAAPGAVEERRLIDDVRTGGHGVDGLGGGRAESSAVVLDRAVELDASDGSSVRLELAQVALLVLEAALADHIELGIGAHRPLHQARHRRALELREVLTGEIGDQVRGGVDGSSVDRLHDRTLASVSDRLPVGGPTRRDASALAAWSRTRRMWPCRRRYRRRGSWRSRWCDRRVDPGWCWRRRRDGAIDAWSWRDRRTSQSLFWSSFECWFFVLSGAPQAFCAWAATLVASASHADIGGGAVVVVRAEYRERPLSRRSTGPVAADR